MPCCFNPKRSCFKSHGPAAMALGAAASRQTIACFKFWSILSRKPVVESQV
jgi:hypothetical protein